LIWAQPVADILSIGLSLTLYVRVSGKMMKGNAQEMA